jgi:hypothetical protein
MAQAGRLGAAAVVQPCSCRDAEGTSRRASTASVASLAGLKSAKSIPLASSLGESAAQRDALRRSAFATSSVTTGGRKAVVCMAAEGNLPLPFQFSQLCLTHNPHILSTHTRLAFWEFGFKVQFLGNVSNSPKN